MSKDFPPVDLSEVKTYPLKERKSKISVKEFAKVSTTDPPLSQFINNFPKILAAKNFQLLVNAILRARHLKKPVIFAFGGHVIKCGLNPVIIELIDKGVITGIALNGSGIIHDFEIALVGETSEFVEESLPSGSFGMAEETGKYLNEAINEGVGKGWGIGKAVGEKILELDCPYKKYSILAKASLSQIPATVHVAIGADTIHQHPIVDGGATGKGTFTDFRIFASLVTQLGDGGVFINIGSSVILPEVFLKALNIARNLGYKVTNFTTANFDMIHHYRPKVNVIERPNLDGGKGYSFIGHHELMIPFLAGAILSQLR